MKNNGSGAGSGFKLNLYGKSDPELDLALDWQQNQKGISDPHLNVPVPHQNVPDPQYCKESVGIDILLSNIGTMKASVNIH